MFRKAILIYGLDIETFINDTSYFLKSSSARREDYAFMEIITDIEAKYALRHICVRWLSMKKPILRLLQQWENILEYFFKFIPKEDDYKKVIKSSNRYKRIIGFLKDPTSKAGLCFIAFVSCDFEDYLTRMQTNEPMIHCMYEMMSSLLFNLMKKFVVYSEITTKVDGVITAKQGSDLISVNISKHTKKLDAIDIGTKAKSILNDFSINSESKEIFRKKCLGFFTASTKYLVSHLPISSQFLKDARYLHPDKRNYDSAVKAISRLALTVGNSLKNHLETVFSVSKDTTVSDICDLFRDQFQIYQQIDISKEWYIIETVNAKKERLQHQSYWKNAEKSWLEILPKEDEVKTIRIDSYWSRVFELKNDAGRLRFPQLAALVKSVLTLSHGNAGPEQGFSINKSILDAHGTRLREDTIVALRRVKHRIIQVGGVLNFQINKQVLESVKLSRGRYEEELKANEQINLNNSEVNEMQESNELIETENKIKDVERGIKVAEEAIKNGSDKLNHDLNSTFRSRKAAMIIS